MTEEVGQPNAKGRKPLSKWHWLWQIGPPVALLALTFGEWDAGVTMILGVPLLVSLVRLPFLIVRRELYSLPRPALTVAFGLLVVFMGNYYANEAKWTVWELAQAMQVQCNRDGYCKLPTGFQWRNDTEYKNLYFSKTTGLVPFRVVLTFNETEAGCGRICDSIPGNKKDTVGPDQIAPKEPTTFHLERQLEDRHFQVYGGVGRTLNKSD